jgi:hypothetical protein
MAHEIPLAATACSAASLERPYGSVGTGASVSFSTWSAVGPLCARIDDTKTNRLMPARLDAAASSAVAARLTRS